MDAPFVFGLEFELAAGLKRGMVTDRDRSAAYDLIRRAVCQLSPWLPDGGNGIFTPGFRLYLDAGNHTEVALVEVSSPRQLLELKAVAFELLAQAVARARQTMPDLLLLANNHDYLEGTYWGCHESYAITRHPRELAGGMLPFLATRPLIAGNGRLDSFGRVLLSTRAVAMDQTTGGETMHSRALYSTCRDEPLMAGGPFFHRLHLICGDSLMSEWGEFLKVGATALVLEWLQKDPHAADLLRHRLCPLRLLKTSNVVWWPKKGLRVHRKALEIQRFYCGQTRRFVERSSSLPDWCREVVVFWDQTLDLLEDDPLALTDRADPFIKLALFEAVLKKLGRDWSEIATDAALYHQLALIDVAYHQVGGVGPFQQLDKDDRLNHRLVAVEDRAATLLDVARRLGTRAAPRAELIAAMSGQTGVTCNWAGFERRPSYDRLDLSNPLQTDKPVWQRSGDRVVSPGIANRRAPGPERLDVQPSSRPGERDSTTMRRETLRRLLEFFGDNL
jgi:Pup-ligase protein